jgi:hypothetical protein
MKATQIVTSFALAAVAAGAQAQSILHANLAQEIVRGLYVQGIQSKFTDANGVSTNRYGAEYPNFYFTVPVAGNPNSVYSVDGRCASFVTMMLKACYNWDPGDLGDSPYADEYYDSVNTSTFGFTKRTDFSMARYGDIIASKYSNNGDTGHVMILQSKRLLTYNMATQTREYIVGVLDCSKDPHTDDTRTNFPQQPTGAGLGYIRVKTVNNLPTQWSWKTNENYYSSAARPIVVGFFTPQ